MPANAQSTYLTMFQMLEHVEPEMVRKKSLKEALFQGEQDYVSKVAKSEKRHMRTD
jgi:hypothetical protein